MPSLDSGGKFSVFSHGVSSRLCDSQIILATALAVYTIAKKFAFSASHTIGGLSPEHPCGRLHGHNYEVEVIPQAAALDGVGFVRDYRELAALREFLNAAVDHNHLNDVLGHDATTAEALSKWLYDWCKTRWPEVVAVRVSESPRTWAEYRP
jgi:6-pyruvoyltetrahydropterin/6-carboxytetrahydropterin synthase